MKNTIEAIKENFETVEESTKLESKLNLLNSVINDEANHCPRYGKLFTDVQLVYYVLGLPSDLKVLGSSPKT